MLLGLAAGLALAVVISHSHAASAEDEGSGPPWLRIERMETTPSMLEGYASVRFFATAVTLRGEFIDISGKGAWDLMIGSQKKRIPYIAGQFHALEDELALAIVVDTSSEFGDILPQIQDELVAFVETLPKKRTQVAIIGVDERVHGTGRVRPIKYAVGEIRRLYTNTEPSDKALLDAVAKARRGVARAKPETEGAYLRRMIVVISDGRDVDYPNPRNYRKVSRRAGRDGIPIHTIAFAPDGNRLPLRGMGELSKNSEGTFRFAYTKSGFKGHFIQLSKEIVDQYVITFFVPFEDIKAKKIGLAAHEQNMVSTTRLRVGKLVCGMADEKEEETCGDDQYCVDKTCVTRTRDTGRGIGGWLLLIGGIALGLIVFFVLLTMLVAMLNRRRMARQVAGPVGLPTDGQAEAQNPYAQAQADDGGEAGDSSHRIVAQGPYGKPVQPSQPRGRMPSPGGQGGGQGQPNMPPTGQQRIMPTGGHGRIPPTGGHGRIPPTGAHGQVPPTGAHGRIPPTGAHGAAGHAPRAHAPVQGARPSLLMLAGPFQGQRIPLHNGFLIGKAPGCHLVLAGDNFVSGNHARIEMDARGTCVLYDMGSTNGTAVNGVRVNQKQLAHGYVIKIGNTEARFLAQ